MAIETGKLCDISEDFVSKFINTTSNWNEFRTSRHVRLFDSISIARVPEKYQFMETVLIDMVNKIVEHSPPGEKINVLETFLCYYPDGSYSTGTHRHRCRSMTLSIGFQRTFKVNNRTIVMNNGDYIILSKQPHGVPKSGVYSGPRLSINMFYCYESDENVSINY